LFISKPKTLFLNIVGKFIEKRLLVYLDPICMFLDPISVLIALVYVESKCGLAVCAAVLILRG